MKEQGFKWVALGLLILFVLGCIGCGKNTEVRFVSQPCKVEVINTDAVITCPDGSSVVIPAEIIHETITTVVEVPVIIYMPRCGSHHNDKVNNKCKKG